jgi:hypothetical protein
MHDFARAERLALEDSPAGSMITISRGVRQARGNESWQVAEVAKLQHRTGWPGESLNSCEFSYES